MLITQLKDTEVIKSLAGGKVFLLCCHGCKEVSFPEHDGEGLEKELNLTGKKVTDYICNPENLKVRLEGCAEAIESADAVLVMGGTNDVGLDTLLGEWDSEDTSTFYGALNALIVLLRANFPGKPIIFCTPIKRKYDTDNGFPDTMADLKTASATEQITMQHCVLAIKAKCAQHGIPVIDLAEHSGFSPLAPEYYRNADDNLHPSALGHVRIANMVQAELEKQFAYKPD